MDGSVVLQVLTAALQFTMFPLRTVVASASLFLSALANPSWQKYVRSPASHTVHPVAIVSNSVAGNVSNPNGFLHGRPTVLTRESGQDAPSLVVDFGQNVVGLLEVAFGHSKSFGAGLPGVKLAFSETLQFLGNTSDFTRSDNASGDEKLTNGTDQIAVSAQPYTWKDLHGCQHGRQVCSDGLHGFRYVKIWLDALAADAPYTSPFGSVEITSISLEWSAYLGTPSTFTGWFESSDADLTQWWYDGVYTVDMDTDVFLANETEPRGASSPTLEGKQVLFDGAKRDRDPYVGDLGVSSLTSYLSHDFAESTRNVLVDLALHQRSDGWIPPASINNYTLPLFDYPLWWVVASVDLVMYTGDTSYAGTYWPNLVKVLDTYYPQYVDASGMLSKPDSIGYGDYAFLPRSGPITYYNALYVHALQYAGQLADSLGKSDGGRWRSRANSIAAAVRAHNFDKSVGAFFDGGPCNGQAVCNTHAQDGNGLAIIAGIANGTEKSILDYWATTAHPYGNPFYDNDALSAGFKDRVYAFISYFELEARFISGQATSAFEEIRRLYGWMASHDPKITMWEGIGPDGSPYEGAFTSMAHGWSTGIVPLLSNHVLGVKPTAPGFKTYTICPVAGDLSWARGVVPTPKGGIQVSWTKKGGFMSVSVTAPAGTRGTVCSSGGRSANVVEGGHTAVFSVPA